jgi:hypothetical protein
MRRKEAVLVDEAAAPGGGVPRSFSFFTNYAIFSDSGSVRNALFQVLYYEGGRACIALYLCLCGKNQCSRV